MRIGIICEGHTDRAVIANILTGILKIDFTDITAIRPQLRTDETDNALQNPLERSSWSVVKEECEKRDRIDSFLSIEGQDFVVIHLDTAEAEEYGIVRPIKPNKNYCEELRALAINKLISWFKEDISSQILYAIAIEEIDAWILTIYDENDSSKSPRPKEKLQKVLSKKGINTSTNFDNFLKISKPLSKPKEIKKGKFLTYNCSLAAFFEEIQTKVIPVLNNN